MMKKVISVALVVAMLFSLTTLVAVNATPIKSIVLKSSTTLVTGNFELDELIFKGVSLTINPEANANTKVVKFVSGNNSITGSLPADEVIWDYSEGNTPKVTNYDFLTDGKKLEIKVNTKIVSTEADPEPVNVLYSGDISKLNGAKFCLISDDIETTAEIIVNGDAVAYNNRLYTLKADNNKLYLLVKLAVEYNGKLYGTIPEALSDIGLNGNGTIKLLADYKGNFNVAKNQNITLDLNNFVYRFEPKSATVKSSCIIEGKLKITDTSDEKDVTTKYFVDHKCAHGVLIGEECLDCKGKIATYDNCYETQVAIKPEDEGYIWGNGGIVTGISTEDSFKVFKDGSLEVDYVCIIGCYSNSCLIDLEYHASLTIKNSYIGGCYSGASLIDSSFDNKTIIDNCQMNWNTSKINGLIDSMNGTVEIIDSVFSDNLKISDNSKSNINVLNLTLKGVVEIFSNVGYESTGNLLIYKNGTIDVTELDPSSKISVYTKNTTPFIFGGNESLADCFECDIDAYYLDYIDEEEPAGIGLVSCAEYADYKNQMIDYINETFNPNYFAARRAAGDIYFAKYNRNLSLKANIANIAKIVSKLNLEASKDAAEYLNEEVTEIREEGKSTSLIEICSLVANKTRDAFETGAAFTWDFILTCVKNLWALIF